MLPFECAAGSVPGTDHTKPGQPLSKNNQDALICGDNGDDLIVGVVCDGCSGGSQGGKSHNEIGATIGSRLVAQAVARYGNQMRSDEQHHKRVWDRIERDVLSQIHILTNAISDQDNTHGIGSYSTTIADLFLFTIVGFVINPKHTVLFYVGDGTMMVNGQHFGPPHDVAPPYLAYQLTGSRLHDDDSELLHFQTHAFPTAEVQSILVASDGIDDLEESAKQTSIRGEIIGGPNQFWENDKYFKNPDAVRRRLALINQEYVREGTIHYGPLRDDTSLIVARKIPT